MPASTDPGPVLSRSPRWVSVAGLVGLLLVGVLATVAQRSVAPRPAGAPAGEFSAARAMHHIRHIADAPRPLGSPAHAETRQYLIDRLDSLGWNTQVRTGVGATPPAPGTRQLAAVSNVVATMPGTDPTGTVVLAAHYDTVPGSPGAADDGLGVGTLLETARALSAEDTRPRNTVKLLLTDGEELGLLGAEAFVREQAESLGTTVLLNHEARGNRGAPTTFRTTSPNGALLEVLSHAPGTLANSAFEAGFEALPNDTDVTRFAEGGLHSYDTAITGGGAYYHTSLDTPERLSRASLQQMGRASLAMTRELAGKDLSVVPDSGTDLVLTLPWGPVRYPQTAEAPLAWTTLVLAGATVALARRRGALTLPRAAISAGAAIAALAAAGAAAFAVWQVAVSVDPGQASAAAGVPYAPGPYRIAMLLAGLGVLIGAYTVLRRRLGSAALVTGGLVALALLGVMATVALTGASSLLVPPLLPVVLGVLTAGSLPLRWPVVRAVVLLSCLVPAALLLGPSVLTAFEVGPALGGVLGTLFFAVFGWLALSVVEGCLPAPRAAPSRRLRRRKVLVSALGVVLVAATTAYGLVMNRSGATPPRQQELLYALNADTGAAHWASPSAPDAAWTRSLLSRPPAVLDDALPWSDGARLAHGPAPVAELPAPALDVLADRSRGDGTRELTLRLSSPRGASGVGLWIDAGHATVRAATVGGRNLSVGGAERDFGFVFDGASEMGVEVRLVLKQYGDTLPVRIADRGHDPREVPGFTAPPGHVLVEPTVAVSRTRTL